MAENRQHFRFPRIKIQNETGITKYRAVEIIENYINTEAHFDEFYDDESLIIDYIDTEGQPCSSTIIVLKGVDENDNPAAMVKLQLNSDDTIPIVETPDEPKDTEAIWLSDFEDNSGYTYDEEKVLLKEQVKNLIDRNKELEDRILRLEYILTGEYTENGEYVGGGVIAGGDILTNSVKYELQNRYETEKPSRGIDRNYAKDDTAITRYDIYLGDASLFDYVNTDLYCKVYYHLKPRFFNQANEEVKNVDADGNELIKVTFRISEGNEYVSALTDDHVLIVSKKGNITLTTDISNTHGNPINDTKLQFNLKFDEVEKPYYETYLEPNVKHVLTKTVETKKLLDEQSNFLCVGEQVWCNENNTLYIKVKASNGNIILFPIGGVSQPTGDTKTTEFSVENGVLNIKTNDDTIVVDPTGYLVLNNFTVDENGILILTDKN